jgi:2-polyprenyl-3-methyl-5-hydroxy-6-metoxy-1,4-benzoquinol methylase
VIAKAGLFESHDYYRQFKERYWNTLRYVEPCLKPRNRKVLDIGSGQFAILCRILLDVECDVADIDSRHTAILNEQGIGFYPVDLTTGGLQDDKLYDVIIMAEVIEHVPRPPHLVFRDLRRSLRPGGALVVTTPNLYRLRNVSRMVLGKPIFCHFRFPEQGQSLGHFLEYSKEQMIWHLKDAGFQIELATIEQLDMGGATRFARWARRVAWPLVSVRPLWKDNLLFIARRPSEP